MKHRSRKLILGSLTTSGFLLWGLLGLVSGASRHVRATPGDLFILPTGSGDCSQASPCDLPTALGMAMDGDDIYLGAGTYTGSGAAVVTLTHSIRLFGGWDGSSTSPPVRDPETYPTILDGEGQRRVIFISSGITPTIDGLVITGGNASGLGGGLVDPSDAGGGIYSDGAVPLIQHNLITDNVASMQPDIRAFGGGIYINDPPTTATIRQNLILSNTAGVDIRLGDGGGLFFHGPVQVLQNTFRDNHACLGTCSSQGGGLEGGWTEGDALIAGNHFEGNHAGSGGAMQLVWSAVEVRGNTLVGNDANVAGGIRTWYDQGSVIHANRLISNTAATAGGIDVFITLTPDTRLSNNVLVHNRATMGGGIYTWSDWHIATITITHNTLVDNGVGILVGQHMTATLVNNVLVSHTLAITRSDPGSQVSVDHTLFWANGDDGLRGAAAMDGDPTFMNPASDDYHLRKTSAAIDAGVDVGVPNDIDGDPRPLGAGFDLGADEFALHAYLPLVRRGGP